ncbi:MAG: hypothetical protein HW387_982 [Parachlamydiales bacterium]|nr:hypothetical protein [Parachlamydiales bacterium]
MVHLTRRKKSNGTFVWSAESYREFCVTFLAANKIDISGKYNYQFGIFNGTSLRWIYEMYRFYHLSPEKILAFDSFEGLPEEQEGIPRLSGHSKGAYNVKAIENYKKDSPHQIIDKIKATLPDNLISIDWHIGFFEQILTESFMDTNPRPAFWVDIDVDLYISTIQVLDFMLRKHLIVPSTIVSFDDWGATEEYKGGESLAWKEMCEKYSVSAKEIHCNRQGTDCQIVYIVDSIG